MPFRIRPMHHFDIENNFDIFSFSGIEDSKKDVKIKFLKTTEKQRNLLYTIWDENKQKTASYNVQQALNIPEERKIYVIPRNIGLGDITNLSSAGLIKNIGNNSIQFTEAGKMALSKAIMSQPSTFDAPLIKKAQKLNKFAQVKISNDKFENPGILGMPGGIGIPGDIEMPEVPETADIPEILRGISDRRTKWSGMAYIPMIDPMLPYRNTKVEPYNYDFLSEEDRDRVKKRETKAYDSLALEDNPAIKEFFQDERNPDSEKLVEALQNILNSSWWEQDKAKRNELIQNFPSEENIAFSEHNEELTKIRDGIIKFDQFLEKQEKKFKINETKKTSNDEAPEQDTEEQQEPENEEEVTEKEKLKQEIEQKKKEEINNYVNPINQLIYKIINAEFINIHGKILNLPFISLLTARKELDILLDDYGDYLVSKGRENFENNQYEDLLEEDVDIDDILANKIKNFNDAVKYAFILDQYKKVPAISPLSSTSQYSSFLEKSRAFDLIINKRIPVNKFINGLINLLEGLRLSILKPKQTFDIHNMPVQPVELKPQVQVPPPSQYQSLEQSPVEQEPIGSPETDSLETDSSENNSITSLTKKFHRLYKYSEDDPDNQTSQADNIEMQQKAIVEDIASEKEVDSIDNDIIFLTECADSAYFKSNALLALINTYKERDTNIPVPEKIDNYLNIIIDEYALDNTKLKSKIKKIRNTFNSIFNIKESQISQRIVFAQGMPWLGEFWKNAPGIEELTPPRPPSVQADELLDALNNNNINKLRESFTFLIENKELSERMKMIYREARSKYGNDLLIGLRFNAFVKDKEDRTRRDSKWVSYTISKEEVNTYETQSNKTELQAKLLMHLSNHIQSQAALYKKEDVTKIGQQLYNYPDNNIQQFMNDFVFLYNKTSEILYNICFVLAMNSARKTAKSGAARVISEPGTRSKRRTDPKELTNKDLFFNHTNYEAITEIANQLYNIAISYYFPEFIYYDSITQARVRTNKFFTQQLAPWDASLAKNIDPSYSFLSSLRGNAARISRYHCDTRVMNELGGYDRKIKGQVAIEIMGPDGEMLNILETIHDFASRHSIESISKELIPRNVKTFTIIDELMANDKTLQLFFDTGDFRLLIIKIMQLCASRLLELLGEKRDFIEMRSIFNNISDYVIQNRIQNLTISFDEEENQYLEDETFNNLIDQYRQLKLKNIMSIMGLYAGIITHTNRVQKLNRSPNNQLPFFEINNNTLSLNLVENITPRNSVVILKDSLSYFDSAIKTFLTKTNSYNNSNNLEFLINLRDYNTNNLAATMEYNNFIFNNLRNELLQIRDDKIDYLDYELFYFLAYILYEKNTTSHERSKDQENKQEIHNFKELYTIQVMSNIFNNILDILNQTREMDEETFLAAVNKNGALYPQITLLAHSINQQFYPEQRVHRLFADIITSLLRKCYFNNTIRNAPISVKKLLIYQELMSIEEEMSIEEGKASISEKVFYPIVASDDEYDQYLGFSIDLALRNAARIKQEKIFAKGDSALKDEITVFLQEKIKNQEVQTIIFNTPEEVMSYSENAALLSKEEKDTIPVLTVALLKKEDQEPIIAMSINNILCYLILNEDRSIGENRILQAYITNKTKEASAIASFTFAYREGNIDPQYLCENSFIDQYVKSFIQKMLLNEKYRQNMSLNYRDNKIVSLVNNIYMRRIQNNNDQELIKLPGVIQSTKEHTVTAQEYQQQYNNFMNNLNILVQSIVNQVKEILLTPEDTEKKESFIKDVMQIFITRFCGITWAQGGGTPVAAEGDTFGIVFMQRDIYESASKFIHPMFLATIDNLVNNIKNLYDKLVIEGPLGSAEWEARKKVKQIVKKYTKFHTGFSQDEQGEIEFRIYRLITNATEKNKERNELKAIELAKTLADPRQKLVNDFIENNVLVKNGLEIINIFALWGASEQQITQNQLFLAIQAAFYLTDIQFKNEFKKISSSKEDSFIQNYRAKLEQSYSLRDAFIESIEYSKKNLDMDPVTIENLRDLADKIGIAQFITYKSTPRGANLVEEEEKGLILMEPGTRTPQRVGKESPKPPFFEAEETQAQVHKLIKFANYLDKTNQFEIADKLDKLIAKMLKEIS